MKSLKLIFATFILVAFINSCNKPAEIAPTKAEIFKSEVSAGIGAEINTTITANGGTAFISTAAAKIIVPAGAMPVGATFTTQAIADKIDNEGQGISLSGNWSKPITVEFQVPIGIKNPENYKIALRLNNGYWITCNRPKYNSSTRTVSVRIAPTSTVGAKTGAKVEAKKYDLAFAKTFYIKPEKTELDLGEKVKLRAYAKEGFVPVKIDNITFDAEADLEAAIKKFVDASAALDGDSTDDDLVPLTQPNADKNSDEYLVPILAGEYEFTNNKTGFNRSWILMDGPGLVNKTGNAGADYIAPTDEKEKGKIAKVSFLSRNNQTKRDVEAEATIRIKDGLTRYEGTITLIEKKNSTGGRVGSCAPAYLLKDTKLSAKVVLTSYNVAVPNYLGFTSYDDLNAPTNQLLNNIITQVEYSNGFDSKGEIHSRLSGTCGADGIYAGGVSFLINTVTKTYELKGSLSTKYNECEKEEYGVCINGWEKSKTSFNISFPEKTVGKYTDLSKISGSYKDKEVEITWNFTKQE